MSVPKKRLSKRRTRARRSHHKVSVPAAVACSKAGCNGIVKHHHECPVCGTRKTRATAKAAAAAKKSADTKPAKKAAKSAAKKPAAKKPAKKKT